MTMLSIVCTKLLSTNAHLGRRVADHHFKVYIRGSRNGIAILDSDKTLICLRNALHFIGSLSRQKGRSFFLKTNHLFYLEIMEEMVSYFRNVNSHCFDDSQWKIGAFLTNSFANKKKFRSRKKKIHFGLNQQPDCVVILNADRKSSVILEAHRSQIPIVSLGDSTIPWESSKRITYTIPANDSIQFVYLFCHLIMKTVIIENNAINVVSQTTKALMNSTFSGKTAYSSLARSRRMRLPPNRLFKRHFCDLYDVIAPFFGNLSENLSQPQGGAAPVVQHTPPPQGFTDLPPIQDPSIPADEGQSSKSLKWDPYLLQKKMDTIDRNIYYDKIVEEFPESSDDARKAVCKAIAENKFVSSAILTRFKTNAPLRSKDDPTNTAYYKAFTNRIHQIMESEGIKNYSLRDLINLKFDLADIRKRDEILERYFAKQKR